MKVTFIPEQESSCDLCDVGAACHSSVLFHFGHHVHRQFYVFLYSIPLVQVGPLRIMDVPVENENGFKHHIQVTTAK